MRHGWFAFVAGLLLVLPASAQMRSSIRGGSVGRPHPPSGFRGPRFNSRFHRGDRFGNNFLFPYGFYDDYYGDRYPEVATQPNPVVVVPYDRPTAPDPAPPPMPVADPKLIEIPESTVRAAIKAPDRTVSTVFVLADGRRIESQNYTVTDSILTIKESHHPALQIPLDQVNVEATLAANRERGLDLQLPESKSEILISF